MPLVRLGVVLVAALVPMSAASASSSHTVTVVESSNGKVVRVRVGDRVKVKLASTYWEFGPVDGKAVRALGQADVVVGGAGCPKIMGTGCGSATLTLRVAAKGTSTVSASRTSCGEALQCSPDQRAYRVRITVA